MLSAPGSNITRGMLAVGVERSAAEDKFILI